MSANQLISALVIDYVVRMGVDPRVVSIASATLPGEMHFFTEQELGELRVTWDPWAFEPWAIEPYGLGVIAYSKTRDRKRTATFFCHRDKIPRLMITFADAVVKQTSAMQEYIDSFNGLEAMGMRLPKEAASFRVINGLQVLEIRLEKLDMRNLETVKDMKIEGDGPRAILSLFYHAIPTKGAAPFLRVAARNCF